MSERYALRVAPEPLQSVVGTNVGQKDMGNNITEIHQDPPRCRRALDAQRRHPLDCQRVIDVLCNGANLAFGVSRTDDEIIGDGGQLTDVQDQDIFRFLLQ